VVVRFLPSPDEKPVSGKRDSGLRRATTEAASAGAGAEHLAPVSYLPGASPSPAAEAAMGRVRATAEAGGEALSGSPRRGSRDAGAEGGSGPRAARRASNVSIHQLARRGMSRWELEQVLERRGVEAQTAKAELDRLESVGLLDDAALAVSLVYGQHARHGLGRAAIASDLRRRHIAPDIIEDALADVADDDEQQRALELATKRARQLGGLDERTAVRRLSAYLARKGYQGDVVRRAVAEALDANADDES
jgi:regulatory protein